MMRFNTTSQTMEYSSNTTWYPIYHFVRTAVTTSTYSITANDHYIGVNYNGQVTLTLPVGVEGKYYIIKDESGNSSNNSIVINTTSGTIDGATSFVLGMNY